jgi:hypothetical protein
MTGPDRRAGSPGVALPSAGFLFWYMNRTSAEEHSVPTGRVLNGAIRRIG